MHSVGMCVEMWCAQCRDMVCDVVCMFIVVVVFLLDVYGCTLSESKKTQALFRLLKVKVEREVEFQKQAFQLLGCLNTLLTAASRTRTPATHLPLPAPLVGQE